MAAFHASRRMVEYQRALLQGVGKRGEEDVLYWVFWLLARLVLWSQMRLRVAGQKSVPVHGPVLLVSNHLGPCDPLVIGVRLPRPMRILAKAELFDIPVFGWLIRHAGVVPIRRGASDREALHGFARRLAEGDCSLVFPEGTYHYAPELPGMLPVRTGAAWLALRTGASVMPVGIWGTESVWVPARGWRLGKRPPVGVQFGEAYQPQVPAGMSLKAGLDAIAQDMALRIARLVPEEYRGVYAAAIRAERERPAAALSLDAGRVHP